MTREKKNNHPVTLRMDAEVYKKLNEYCKETGLSKTVAIERAIMLSIEQYDKQKSLLNEICDE